MCRVKIAAVGDIALTHTLNDLLDTKSPDYPFKFVRKLFDEHDIVIANLEAPISEKGNTYPLKCSLRTKPAFIYGLKNSGINVVSLANNHILDYGDEAFYDTLNILEENGIAHSGAGSNLSEARKSCIKKCNGVNIAFLSYCDVEIKSPFYADHSIRGIAPLNLNYIKEDIETVKHNADIIIVSLHWGIENRSYPAPKQKNIAHQIIDFGCDIILGHHPHVLQGYEKYNNGYIFYSLGNFIFPNINWEWVNKFGKKIKSSVILTNKNKRSIMLSVEITNNQIEKIYCISAQIKDDFITVLDTNKSEIKKCLQRLSYPLNSKFYPLFYVFYGYNKKVINYFILNFKKIRKLHKIKEKLLLLYKKDSI